MRFAVLTASATCGGNNARDCINMAGYTLQQACSSSCPTGPTFNQPLLANRILGPETSLPLGLCMGDACKAKLQ